MKILEGRDYKKQGKKNRKAGKDFEKKVRAFLEKEWIVAKFSNNLDLEHNRMIPAKSQYNPFFKRIIGEGSGFPDFIAFKKAGLCDDNSYTYDIIGVECKMGKYLDREEKEKIKWLLEHYIFSKIFVASPGIKRGEIKMEEVRGDTL